MHLCIWTSIAKTAIGQKWRYGTLRPVYVHLRTKFCEDISKTSQISAELLRFSVFQNGGRPPSWILLPVKSDVTARCGLSMSKFCDCISTGGWVIAFCGKIQNGSKFGVNRTFTFFQDIVAMSPPRIFGPEPPLEIRGGEGKGKNKGEGGRGPNISAKFTPMTVNVCVRLYRHHHHHHHHHRDGNGSVGHGSWVKWVTILDGSRGSWVTASDPLTHDEITAQIFNTITRLPTFVFLYETTGHYLAYFVLSWH